MIPSESVRLKNVATINDEQLVETTDPDYVFEYVDVGSVGRGFLVENPDKVSFGEAPTRARRKVRAGDTIVSTVRTYLRAILPITPELDDVVVSTGFAVIRPRSAIDSRFLAWALQGDPFVEEVVARSTGVSYPAIAPSTMANISLTVPTDRKHQHQIADFLDRETHRIDALADAKRRMIDLLEEKLASTITVLATGGVGFSNSGAIQDLDVDGLPAGWRVSTLGRVTKSISDGPFGSALATKHYTTSGVRVIRLGNIGQGVFIADDKAYIAGDYASELRKHELFPGDVVVAGLGDDRRTLGRACVVPTDVLPAIHKADCYRVVVERFMDPLYTASLLSSRFGSAFGESLSQGTTRRRINTEIASRLPVLVPPLDEQRQIAKTIDRARHVVETATGKLQDQLDLLAEYRQALITQAVMGQLDAATLKGDKPVDEVVGVIPE